MIKDPTIESTAGDILFGAKNKNKQGIKAHYIIYIGEDSNQSDLFFGAMLTHSPKFNNIPLLKKHFETHSARGKRFKITYNNSFFSPDLYHKRKEWAPFKKVGQLTKEGLNFINKQIGHKVPVDFKHNL